MKTFNFYSLPQDQTIIGRIKGTSKEVSIALRIPRLTICGVFNPETNEISFGTSRCSTKDQFNRKKGRMIATGRAMKNPTNVLSCNDQRPIDVFIKESIELCKTYDLPCADLKFKKDEQNVEA